MPVRTGFTTTNRYSRLVGLMMPIITRWFNAQITRFSGSMGSGTDLGSTTVSVTDELMPAGTASCPRVHRVRHHNKGNRANLRMRRWGWMFSWFASPGVALNIRHLY